MKTPCQREHFEIGEKLSAKFFNVSVCNLTGFKLPHLNVVYKLIDSSISQVIKEKKSSLIFVLNVVKDTMFQRKITKN